MNSRFALRTAGLGLTLAAVAAVSGCGGKPAAVTRYKVPNSNFPIAMGVEIPAGNTIIFLSGMTPSVADDTQPKDSVAAYGDTKTQTLSALKKIDDALKSMGLGMKDVVKMQVFMAGDPNKGGKMDFPGMMEGYTQYFGTKDQPNLPSRSAMQVAALANPGFLVEIEVAAVRP
jgi:enamine deaminase RidA (YjgF/YER057c/UK114 family)